MNLTIIMLYKVIMFENPATQQSDGVHPEMALFSLLNTCRFTPALHRESQLAPLALGILNANPIGDRNIRWIPVF